ncbi:FAD-dependent oxidoreductase [Novosphingobium profundi]|uniref:GMC family oxidoreductase n=1 Tax=Novosphingobium profundi TaxID=1774954 RepID=UPI001BD9986F|nr:GMC family oxidoreductase N-terminal domain-containing protein [Novosphingobium profundi]MBT0667328.1 FAD-dependent oxidoreductase [Novosphingobium profundi]
MSGKHFDVLIVGSGAAGCVVADYLSEHTDKSIAVLEAGPLDRNPMIHIPAGYSKLLAKDKAVWPYETVVVNGQRRRFRMGKVVGGGTSVNAMCYVRGQKQDFDAWQEAVGEEGDWSWETMRATYIEQERNNTFHNEYHGIDGPLSVELPGRINELNQRCMKAFQEFGLPYNPDYNGQSQAGVSPVQSNTDNGKRASAAVAYLHPRVDSGRVTLLTSRTVTKILIENRKAVGVCVLHGTQEERIYADLVILSAGAVQSPKILMHSGIGPRAQLESFGIPVIEDLAGVGENLHDHPIIPIAAFVKGKMGYQAAAQGLGMLVSGVRYLTTKDGPAAGNGIETVSYWDPEDLQSEEPTVQCYHEPIISQDGLNPSGARSGVTFATVVLQPRSRGTVKLADADPTSMPLIDPNFIGDPYDLKVGIAAVKSVRKVMEQRSLADVIEEEFVPGAKVQTDEELAAFVKQVATTMWHPVGTCKMGRKDDPMAVVDASLKVRGIEALHVIDASIMPRIISGNTNAPTQALARHASKMLVASYFS